MTQHFRWLDRAFGPNALTAWSWLLTLPFAVTVMGGYEYLSAADDGAGFAVAAFVHLLTGAGMLIARYTALRPGQRRYRRTRTLLAFGLLGAIRPFLLIGVTQAIGLNPEIGSLPTRIAINVVSSITMLTLIALLVDALRRHTAVQRRLRAALDTLDLQRDFDEQRLEALRRQYVDDVTARIDSALEAKRDETVNAAQASQLLRAISDDIVRPMSHELFRDERPEQAPTASPRPVPVHERVSRILATLQPAPVVLPFLLMALLFLPSLLSLVGPAFAAVQVALAGFIYLAGNAATMRLARGVRHPASRIVLLALCYAATAIAATLITRWSAEAAGFTSPFYWSPAVIYACIALSLGLIRATGDELKGDEERLADLLAEQVSLTAHTHNRLRLARTRAAHLLHTAVQGELVAAALTLQRRSASGPGLVSGTGPGLVSETVSGTDELPNNDALPHAVWHDVMATISKIKQDVAQGDVEDLTPASDRITALVTMWGSALHITARFDDRVWPLFAAEPARTELAVDALSEGFTNAVRHGKGQRVDVHLDVASQPSRPVIGEAAPPASVVITVRSAGVMSSSPTNGLGLRSLQSPVSTATLSEARGEVSLVVALA